MLINSFSDHYNLIFTHILIYETNFNNDKIHVTRSNWTPLVL